MQVSDVTPLLANAFSDVPEVVGVFFRSNGSKTSVFTIVESEDESVYDQIYERERGVIRSMRGCRLDFNVIARRGRPLSELVPRCIPAWQRNG